MKKIFSISVLLIACTFLLIQTVSARTIRVTDMAGRQVSVPHDPDKIVCIGPGTLRLIIYLNAREKVAGVEDMEKMNPKGRPYWMANTELAALPRIGPGGPGSISKKPDLEAVLNVSPDLIFITYMAPEMADEVQQQLGIPVVILTYGRFATFDAVVYDSLRLAGKILNREKRAGDVVGYIESLRKDLRDRVKEIPQKQKPGIYVGGIGYRGVHGIESTEKDYIPLQWAGAANLAETTEARIGSHIFMDKEKLLLLNPDVIFIDGSGLALVEQDFRKKPDYYQALGAVKSGRVYSLLPFNWYVTNIDTAIADAYAIGKILYPERFANLDPEKKADEIYTFLVGKPVYEEMKAIYGKIGQPVSFLQGVRQQ